MPPPAGGLVSDSRAELEEQWKAFSKKPGPFDRQFFEAAKQAFMGQTLSLASTFLTSVDTICEPYQRLGDSEWRPRVEQFEEVRNRLYALKEKLGPVRSAKLATGACREAIQQFEATVDRLEIELSEYEPPKRGNTR